MGATPAHIRRARSPPVGPAPVAAGAPSESLGAGSIVVGFRVMGQRLWRIGAGLAVVSALAVACADAAKVPSGEGGACDLLIDCQEGLSCVAATNQASGRVCRRVDPPAPGPIPGADAAADATTDAAADATTDAATDATTDAPPVDASDAARPDAADAADGGG